MAAYASVEAPVVPLVRFATRVGAYRYRPGETSCYEHLASVRVLEIRHRDGPHPGVATFRYVFDESNMAVGPRSFEDTLSIDSNVPGVVANDERLVVLAFDVDGEPQVLFDGFAQVPELGLTPAQEQVHFIAYGVAVREWDFPIGGALIRDADDPIGGRDVETDVVTRFNPDGLPNATADGGDAVGPDGVRYPTFIDPLVVRSADVRRHWTVPMAVRYLCFRQNSDQNYVINPGRETIDALLDSRSPGQGDSFFPDDPSTYEANAIIVPDYPATGKPWPVAVSELISPHGFGMIFRLTTEAQRPVTRLEFHRRRDATGGAYKDLFLQERGSPLDPGRTNLAQAQLARDTSGIANEIVVEPALTRYEASFILAPGFVPDPADAASASSLRVFDRNHPEFAGESLDKYRLYAFDETGEGHWNWSASAIDRSATPLDGLFNDGSGRTAPYARRRRVPFGELFTLDANGKPLRAQLAISTDYSGAQPGLWDGSGTWQTVVGGFDLLRDRLGIWINAPNPNGWPIGASRSPGAPYPSGVVRGVEDQAAAGAARFTLRLTCVIEGDQHSAALAARRPSSPTRYRIQKRVDARDRCLKHVKAARSVHNPSPTPLVVRDDNRDAQAEADARRLAMEAGEVSGIVVIPRFTTSYRLGDKIRAIQGRNLSLRTNAGAPSVEGEVFPTVIGLTWDFDGQQRTILELSDQRGAV